MKTKKWYLSRTIWLSVLIVVGGIAEYIAGLPAGVSASTTFAGIIYIIVRFLTTQPIGK